jgi:hypothetical protein
MPTEKKEPVNNLPEEKKPEIVEVEKAQLDMLIAVNKSLATENTELKADLGIIISGFGDVAGMFAGKGLSMGTLTTILQKKDKLAATMAPAFEVIQKYTVSNESPEVDQK